MSDLVDQGSAALKAMIRDALYEADRPEDDYGDVPVTAAFDPSQGAGNVVGDGPAAGDPLYVQLARAVGLR